MFDPEFFPTPRPVIDAMLARISTEARHFLDPSAGKGDIADAIATRDRYYRQHCDCIEIHPELIATLQGKGHTVVGTDWLTYSGVSYYDAVVMNPPFSNGDAHLLKAWDFLYSGEIVCLLNAETVRNPYTERRQRLRDLIALHGNVEELGPCFQRAERSTDAEIVLVYLRKETEDDRLELWQDETTERAVDESIGADPQWLAVVDTLGNMQHYYDQANVHMFKAFQHLRKAALYMEANGLYVGHYDNIPQMAMDNVSSARAEFARLHRKDAWTAVFNKMDYHKWLDKQQREQMLRDVEQGATIPFTKENMKGTLENIWQQRWKLFEISVAHVFDELTRYYEGNREWHEGWKSNDNYKVNKRIVFPYGCSYEPKWGFRSLYGYGQIDIYNDLDRVLCMLDGQDFGTCYTIGQALTSAFKYHEYGRTSTLNSTESRYFDIRFYKKGTVHLRFRDDHLWQAFNVTAAAGRRWLGMQTQSPPTGQNHPADEEEDTSAAAEEGADDTPDEAPETEPLPVLLLAGPPITALPDQPTLFSLV
jgi:hypothetical protein